VNGQPIKVLLGKLGLDGHDRGIKVIARGLRDHGMEVIYLGMRLTPEQMAAAALQEDVDVVGVSILSGAHRRLLPKLVKALKERGMDDVLVLAGGTIPEADEAPLRKAGVHAIFRQSASVEDIAAWIKERLEAAT
jgi:methylmalonyl-CoA mutase C-terminal domain/subunit